MQVGRAGFAVAALGPRPLLRRNFARLLVWKATAGAFWLAGAALPGTARVAAWSIAVVIEYSAAFAGFYLPGMGRSDPRDWQISGRHLAERCRLFVLIALGESIFSAGRDLGQRDLAASVLLAFACAFLGTVALWWIYFDRAAGAAMAVIGAADEPGRLGRSAYTYHHLPIVAGIIVTAVGDERAITHPLGPTDAETAAVLLGGPALFLLGHALFKRAVFGHFTAARLLGAAALAALAPVALVASPLVLCALATLVLFAVIGWDIRLLRRAEG